MTNPTPQTRILKSEDGCYNIVQGNLLLINARSSHPIAVRDGPYLIGNLIHVISELGIDPDSVDWGELSQSYFTHMEA